MFVTGDKMFLYEFKLEGDCQVDFDTEIRYNVASAKIASADLIKMVLPKRDSDRENERIGYCILKVLRTLKKEGIIQFFVNSSGFEKNTTQAQYLINIYQGLIDESSDSEFFTYIKL